MLAVEGVTGRRVDPRGVERRLHGVVVQELQPVQAEPVLDRQLVVAGG